MWKIEKKIAFWNVAEITNTYEILKQTQRIRCDNFNRNLVRQKSMIPKVKDRLPKGYKWGVQFAIKRNKKGRTMGEMLMGIRRNMFAKINGFETEEGLMTEKNKDRRRELANNRSICKRRFIESKVEALKHWMKEKKRRESNNRRRL